MPVTSSRLTKAGQVRQHLVDLVDNGLAPHDKLPTERELADEFDISRLTVRRALDELENDGIIYRIQGAGTFVSEQSVAKSIRLTSFTEDMRARGLAPDSRLLTAEIIPAGATISYALNLSPTMPVVHLERVRLASAVPMCLENSYLPEALVPGLVDIIGRTSLYEALENHYCLHIDWADQVIKATVIEPAAAVLLDVPAFSPAFLVVRTIHDNRGRPIEHTESLYRGDRYSYELTLRRHPAKRETE